MREWTWWKKLDKFRRNQEPLGRAIESAMEHIEVLEVLRARAAVELRVYIEWHRGGVPSTQLEPLERIAERLERGGAA